MPMSILAASSVLEWLHLFWHCPIKSNWFKLWYLACSNLAVKPLFQSAILLSLTWCPLHNCCSSYRIMCIVCHFVNWFHYCCKSFNWAEEDNLSGLGWRWWWLNQWGRQLCHCLIPSFVSFVQYRCFFTKQGNAKQGKKTTIRWFKSTKMMDQMLASTLLTPLLLHFHMTMTLHSFQYKWQLCRIDKH